MHFCNPAAFCWGISGPSFHSISLFRCLFSLHLVLLLFLYCQLKKNSFANGSDFFSLHKLSNILRARLFGMALVEQLGDDGWWYVQLAAVWQVDAFLDISNFEGTD